MTLKQLFHISPGNTEIVQPILALQIGKDHCSFSITGTGNQLGELGYYTADDLDSDHLSQIFSSHPGLNHSFYRVLVSYIYPESEMIPMNHFEPGQGGAVLDAMHDNAGNGTLISEIVPGWQLYNIYRVPASVHKWINRKFPEARHWHGYTVAIKAAGSVAETGSIILDISRDDFILLACRDKDLLLAQTFSYTAPADVIYHLLKICQQLGFSQQEVSIRLSGLVDQHSALYSEIAMYFLHTGFRNAGWEFSGTTEYPAHFFTALNDLIQCAS